MHTERRQAKPYTRIGSSLIRRLAICLFMLFLPAAHGKRTGGYARARELCDALLKSPTSAEALERFRAGIAELDSAKGIRTHMMAAYGLGMLSLGHGDHAQKVKAYLKREHPDSPALLHFEPDGLTVVCPTCNGKKKKPCPSCKGSPQCTRCKGKGWIPGPMIGGIGTRPACPSCRGTGKCARCGGRGHILCATCGGKGRVWQPDKIRERYNSCLRETRQRAFEYEHPEMLAVRQDIDKAKRSYSLAAAIGILEGTVARYPDTPNIGIARNLLAKYREDKKAADLHLAAKKLLVENAKRKPHESQNASARINELIGRFMNAQQKGMPGTECWAEPKDARHVFAPVSWQSLRTSIVGSFAEVRFLVEADGVGPSAMRKGTLYLTFNGAWKIQMVKMDARK